MSTCLQLVQKMLCKMCVRNEHLPAACAKDVVNHEESHSNYGCSATNCDERQKNGSLVQSPAHMYIWWRVYVCVGFVHFRDHHETLVFLQSPANMYIWWHVCGWVCMCVCVCCAFQGSPGDV
jgi:hypothetical protein